MSRYTGTGSSRRASVIANFIVRLGDIDGNGSNGTESSPPGSERKRWKLRASPQWMSLGVLVLIATVFTSRLVV